MAQIGIGTGFLLTFIVLFLALLILYFVTDNPFLALGAVAVFILTIVIFAPLISVASDKKKNIDPGEEVPKHNKIIIGVTFFIFLGTLYSFGICFWKVLLYPDEVYIIPS